MQWKSNSRLFQDWGRGGRGGSKLPPSPKSPTPCEIFIWFLIRNKLLRQKKNHLKSKPDRHTCLLALYKITLLEQLSIRGFQTVLKMFISKKNTNSVFSSDYAQGKHCPLVMQFEPGTPFLNSPPPRLKSTFWQLLQRWQDVFKIVGIKFYFPYEGVILDFSSFTSSMFLIKLAKNFLAYSKNDGHEEKGNLLLDV